MEEFNWREEKSFNITSDLSSFEEERTEAGDGDASANTLVQNETGSSVLGEPSTPTASNQCHWPSSVTPSGRLSLSQPELPAKSTPPTKTSRLNMSTGNISSGSGKPPRPYRAPLSQTLEENKHLREELAVLKSKLNVEKYKVAELTALQPREVQDILEEYYALQLSKFDLEGERKQMAEERRQLNLEIDNVEVRAQTKIEALERQLRDSEKKYQAAVQQNEQYTERIRQLEADIAKWEEVPTSIDGLKGEDSDWTIRSEGDIVSEELRKRLAMLEKENKALYQKIDEQRKKLEERAATLSDTTSQSRTFTVGSGCDVETLLQRIDHLEASLHIVEEERNKTSSALVAYMSRCHSLEKKIRNANLSYTNLTVPVQTKEEVWRLVENIRDVLRALGKQNKELRKECTLLLGRNDQSGLSPDSSGALSTPGRVNIPGTLVEKSLLFAEDFEKKQQEVMENLKSLTDNVANFDESLINILKDIGLSDDDAAEPRKSDAVVAEELANTDQANISQNRADPNNVSMLNASLVELMNRSMNTSKDIAGFKVKLVSLRDVMHRMFENLRSSGVLFEDILELLGSGTDEMRNLAERIRAMKFEWDSAIEEKHVVMEAIEETVVSVNRMQMELSAWEQSLNETSFRLDVSMAHSTTQCFSVQTAQNDEGAEVSPPQQELAELQAHISKNAEEISQLRSKIEEANQARDMALSCADDLRSELKQMETRLISMTEERDGLITTIQSDEAEKRMLKESVESQLALTEQVQRDVLQFRSETDALNRELGAKDAIIVELEVKLAATKESNVSLKELVAERDSQLDELHAALDEEQERKRVEQEGLKADLATAQDTSSALRRDFERIRNELKTKDERIRQLQDQLGIVEENNLRMAEVVSDLASDKQKAVRSSHTHSTAAAEVQTIPPMAKVKSRDVQTDLTRTSLAQMECDSVSYSSELKALYTAYAELREAIGQLVVKNIEPLPNTSDIACIEKSCKEMSRLIHHERRRRENQANEIAAMTAKVEDLRQKGVLEAGGASLKNVPESCVTDAAAHAKKFGDPMRQTLFVLTAMAMDLVKQLRRLSLLNTAGQQVDFTSTIDLARKLRNELNDRFLIVRSEKENENMHCVSDLIHMVKILERDNRTLHENVKVWQKEYEALEKQHKGNPEVTERITRQLRSIHSVMGEFRQACGQLQNTANTRKDGPAQ